MPPREEGRVPEVWAQVDGLKSYESLTPAWAGQKGGKEMGHIILKYQGECRKCGAVLPEGANAIYKRQAGIFCPTCEPKGSEEIRAYRQEGSDRKADHLDEWAEKREAKASAQLNSHPEIRQDWAFITQPGRIPFRDRMNKADGRAFESLQVARGMRNKAERLRHIEVKGDAENRRQKMRDLNAERFEVGDVVNAGIYGKGTILKINKKTARIRSTGASGTATFLVDLAFLSPLTPVGRAERIN